MKNIFIYLVIIIFVGIGVWFFVDKAKQASKDTGLVGLATEQTPTPAPTTEMTNDGGEKWITLSNGLKILDLQIGYGKEAGPGDMVDAHYSGTLENGTKFDSSYDRGQPFQFVLGAGMVIQGWDIGIAGMKVGGKRKLIIPAELGYGDKEVGGGLIPANSTLIFEVELVNVTERK